MKLKKLVGGLVGLSLISTLYFTSCDMFGSKDEEETEQTQEQSGEDTPSGGDTTTNRPDITDVIPAATTVLETGKTYDVSFKCDGLDNVRIQFVDDKNQELTYAIVSKENGAFARRLYIPKNAVEVVICTQDKTTGAYYARVRYQVTGTKTFGELTLPESYDKAYTYRTNEPDTFVKAHVNDEALEETRQSDPLKYVTDVCALINTEAGDDSFRKAKMIHDWLCLLLPYDIEAAKNLGTVPQDYWSILKNKKAICQGYAYAFDIFAELCGLDSQYVFGYTKRVTHAWNIVRIDGKCYLVDTTWDTGNSDESSDSGNYKTEYLFIRPEFFIFEHFAENPAYQLLSNAIESKDTFMALPEIKPEYFDVIENPIDNALFKLSGEAAAAEGLYSFSYKLKDKDTVFEVKATKGTTAASTIIKYNEDKTSEAMFSLPETGSYDAKVILFKNGADTGRVVAQFKINAEKASDVTYQTLYKPLNSLSITDTKLTAGTSYDFNLNFSKDVYSCSIYLCDSTKKKVANLATLNNTYKIEGTYAFERNVTIPAKGITGGEEFDVAYALIVVKSTSEAELTTGTSYFTVVDSE